jgi:uncharacterized protein YdaU (DUF1376 family)
MSKSPAFQFYPGDFLAGRVATYSLEEVGAYSLLLAFDWSLSGLPLEPERLAKLCRVSLRKFRPIWDVIAEQFPVAGSVRHNPRLQLEREKQATTRKKKVDAANARWNAPAHPSEYADASSGECLSTSSSFTTKEKSTEPAESGTDANEESVLAHYLAKHPRRKVGPKDTKAVRAALERYSVGDLQRAIDGNAADTWHRERHKHELTYVLRDTKLDGFIAMGSTLPEDRRIVDDFGCLTEYGERVTRPTLKVAS